MSPLERSCWKAMIWKQLVYKSEWVSFVWYCTLDNIGCTKIVSSVFTRSVWNVLKHHLGVHFSFEYREIVNASIFRRFHPKWLICLDRCQRVRCLPHCQNSGCTDPTYQNLKSRVRIKKFRFYLRNEPLPKLLELTPPGLQTVTAYTILHQTQRFVVRLVMCCIWCNWL